MSGPRDPDLDREDEDFCDGCGLPESACCCPDDEFGPEDA